jgi:hypothetical protein
MNLSIYFPYAAGTCYDVATYTKDELIDELFDVWQAGYDLTQGNTELPKNIIDLSKFDTELLNIVQGEGLKLNQATEDHVRKALDKVISDEWDVLNELINNHDEDFAEACIEYANGGSLEDAEQAHIGYYKSAKDYCEEVFECPDNIRPYIDWDAVWADYCHDVTEINGYYFNS